MAKKRKPESASGRRLVLALSDTHGGHRLALLNPATALIREGDAGQAVEWAPVPTATQKYLWKVYLEQLAEVRDLAGDDEVLVLHVGDSGWGDKHPEGLLAGITREDQRVIARDNLLPALRLPTVRKARLLSGTLAHAPDDAEARVAAMLQKETGLDVQAAHHSRLTVDGVLFDVAHHGPHPGSRDWLRGNVALYYLRDRVYRDRRMGRKPARVYLRGHFHEWVEVPFREVWRGKRVAADLVILPSWMSLTWFARRVTQSAPALAHGMAVFEVVDGRLQEIRPYLRELDLRTEETL
jgi:hypothetical protein